MIKCKRCGNECDGSFGSGVFCNRACANARNHSVETKNKTSQSLLSERVIKTCPVCKREFSVLVSRKRQRCCSNSCHSSRAWQTTASTKFSSRRIRACLTRANAMRCLSCGWDQTSCDLHHIRGRKIENPDSCTNITLLCPNCHRMVHERKLDVTTVKTLADHLQTTGLSYLVV